MMKNDTFSKILSESTIIEYINSSEFIKSKSCFTDSTQNSSDDNTGEIKTIEQAANPVVLWSCLNEISPDWFDNQIHPSVYPSDNEAILCLIHYINELCEDKFMDLSSILLEKLNHPNVEKNTDFIILLYSLVILLELTISGDVFVDKILGISEYSQVQIQELIQKVSESQVVSDGDNHFGRELSMKVDSLISSKSYFRSGSQKDLANNENTIFTLKKKIADLEERINSIENEKEEIFKELSEKKNAFEDERSRRIDLEALSNQKHDELYKNFAAQNDELERQLEVYKKTLEAEKKERKKIEDGLKSENKDLLDEVDLLKGELSQIKALQAQSDIQKVRMEELIDLKSQKKILEEKNNEYVQKLLQIENDVKNIEFMRKSLNNYKEKLAELEVENQTLKCEKDKHDVELDQLTKKLLSTESTAKMMSNEIAFLKLELENKVNDIKELESTIASKLTDGNDSISRDKVIQLENENKLLKEGKSPDDLNSKIFQLESDLDDTKRINLKLERNLVSANARIKLLESQSNESDEFNKLASKISDLERQNIEYNSELIELREKKDMLSSKVIELMEQNRSHREEEILETKVKHLENLLASEKESSKLQESLVEAKLAKQYDSILRTIKKQLQLRDKEAMYYKKALKVEINRITTENNLVASALYQLGTRYNQLKCYATQLENEMTAAQACADELLSESKDPSEDINVASDSDNE